MTSQKSQKTSQPPHDRNRDSRDEQTRAERTAEEALREETILDQEVLFGWNTLDSRHHERSPMWYVTAAIAGIGLIVYAIFTQAWTLAVAVALLAGVIFLLSQDAPEAIQIIITKMGIHVGKKFYPYNKIKSFWIVSEPGYNGLYFQTTGKLPKLIQLNLEDESPVTVRDLLSAQVPEEADRSERFIDTMARKMKL